MDLEKITKVGSITITETNIVEYQMKDLILEDGIELSAITSNKTIAPGGDYSDADAKVQAVCKAVHTPEVVAQYQAEQEANKPQV